MWVGWAALHREAVRIDDVARDGRAIAISGTPLGAKSVTVIPLLVEEMLVGVARAVKMGVRSYTDDHFRFAQTLASQAALAIAAAENARGDRMKTVNDQFGHAEGDRRLVEISESLRGSLRISDVLTAAERLRQAVSSHEFRTSWGERMRMSMSIGTATSSGDQLSADDLFRAADRALYQSNQNGRNRVTAAAG